MSKVFFTADLHFGHTHILEFTGRPFNSIQEHDEGLVERWNDVVCEQDTVYVLGDFTGPMRLSRRYLRHVFDWLNGTKILIAGNHDSSDVLKLPWSRVIKRQALVRVGGVNFCVAHHPADVRAHLANPQYFLHGHLHSTSTTLPLYDVGVDVKAHALAPVDSEFLLAKIRQRETALNTLIGGKNGSHENEGDNIRGS